MMNPMTVVVIGLALTFIVGFAGEFSVRRKVALQQGSTQDHGRHAHA